MSDARRFMLATLAMGQGLSGIPGEGPSVGREVKIILTNTEILSIVCRILWRKPAPRLIG